MIPTRRSRPRFRLPAVLAVVAATVLTACDDDATATAPTPTAPDELVVLSRNLYLGGDIGRVISAPTPESVPVRVTETWVEVLGNATLSRMSALADEVAATGAHVVGLQEVPIFRVQSPGDVLQGDPTAAETVVFDFLDAFLSELSRRGLDFTVAAVAENVDVELPMAFSPTDFWDLRFSDRDVLLVRSDLDFDDAAAGNFQASAPLQIGGAVPLEVVRGWTRADVALEGGEVTVLNVHLEIPEISGALQEAQMAESLQMLSGAERAVLMGDLNSRADGTTTASYAMALGAGFEDAWLLAGGPADAPTCCYASDLRSPGLVSEQRIDFVLVRAPEGALEVTDAALTGADPALRTPSGLWPSDHRGVVVALEVP